MRVKMMFRARPRYSILLFDFQELMRVSRYVIDAHTIFFYLRAQDAITPVVLRAPRYLYANGARAERVMR